MSTVSGAPFAFSLDDFESRAIERARDVFAPGGDADLQARRFLEQMHEDAVAEDVGDLGVDDMAALAADFWAWAQECSPGTTMIRCRPGRGADGRPLGRDILEIVTDDKPFLVDSVMAETTAEGLEVHAMFHPIVTLEEAGSPRAVSMMQVHLESLDERGRDRLVSALEGVLADVQAAVADYPDMRARMDQAIDELLTAPIRAPAEELEEAVAFLRWLRNDNFAFLGCRVYDFTTDSGGAFLREEPVIRIGTGRGVLRDPGRLVLRRGSEPLVITPQVASFLEEPAPLIVAKANMVSRVHRRVHMDYIGVKRYRADGGVVGETRFVGLFTANAYHASVLTVPLIRRKARRVLDRLEKAPGSHSYRQLESILETYPRDDLFQATEDEIFEIARGILHLHDRPRPQMFVRRDRFDRFLSVLVYIPRERYNSRLREEIGRLLAERWGGRVSAYYPFFGASPLARVHFIIGVTPGNHAEPDPEAVEREIARMSRTWEDELARVAREEAPESLRHRLARYEGAFSAGYRESFGPHEALDDAAAIEAIDPLTGVNVRVFRRKGDPEDAVSFKLYRQGATVPLSGVMPLLESMGLRVLSESSHSVRPVARPGEPEQPEVWVHDFEMRSAAAVDLDSVGAAFEEAFTATWTGLNESDGFNRLVLAIGAGWREVCFLRACARYRQQTGLDPSQQVQERALADNPEIARLLLDLRTVRFDPAFAASLEARKERQAEIDAKIAQALDGVASLDADRVLRSLAAVIRAIQRTSYYQTDPDGRPNAAIAIKIASGELDDLPAPKPFREIYVWSPRVEGVHIRFGPVARGGIRWSDRRDDFRTEVLGLAKAQQVKNAVIVPVGSKGGFFAKQLPKPSERDAWLAEGVEAYKLFISSLLDVTDNIVEGAVQPPQKVVVWDGEDPYLVVAADKGTASFSDIANAISESRGFWLGDAFASGGSAGYDHKAIGITARGAWIAVERHFRELGKNIAEEPFTCIGVGDMSGDVFGNAMLLSKQTRLLAAFDHRDIFIDPNPEDLERLWGERKRLFGLPRSSWADFDPRLISKGGGVYSRSRKSIPLSPEARALTGLAGESATPAELIRALLRAPVELLWFGGIGTFVRGDLESDYQVGDKANDAVRVAASEVRAQVVGEGANLAVTQAGRIGLARRGVRLNTDFIDNSAGVDTSDHEVNIKILLNPIVRAGRLSRAERDELLREMTDEVAKRVLADNYDQTLALSIAESTAAEDLDAYERMIERMEERGQIDRRVELLPSSDQFRELKKQGLGLTRPEIAKLMAQAKITLYNRIVDSSVPDDPHFDAMLRAYFPDELSRFGDEMRSHRLRRELIATALANDIVNLGGATFSHRARESTGGDTDAVARAFEAAREIFGFRDLLARIHALDNTAPASLQLELYRDVIMLLRRQTHWLVRRGRGFEKAPPRPLDDTIETYRSGVQALKKLAIDVLSPFELERARSHMQDLIAKGAPRDVALSVAALRPFTSASDILDLAARTGRPLEAVARVYFLVGDRLRFDRLRAATEEAGSAEHWDRMALRRLIEDLYTDHQRIAEAVLRGREDATGDAAWAKAALDAWLEASAYEVGRADSVLRDLEQGPWTLGKLALAEATLRELAAMAA